MITQAQLQKNKQRHTAAKADRQQYDNYIDTAFRYSIPQRRIYLEAQNKLRPNPEIYDDTAVIGVQKFATKMQSMLVPPAQRWMRYEPGSDIEEDAKSQTQLKYDKYTDVFFQELDKSNFDMQVAESFQDLAVTTGAMVVNPSPIGSNSAVSFKAIIINELSFEVADDGIIRNIWREFDIKLIEIEVKYPDAILSKEHNEALKNNPIKSITVVESQLYDVKTNSYIINLYESGANHIFLERDEKVGPMIVFRENVIAGAAFGFGRVLRVLPSIKTINKIQELELQNGSIAIGGVFTAVDDNVLNPYNVRLRPGVILPVASNDTRNPSLARLDTSTNFNWSAIQTERLEAKINESLMANPYGSIENTPVRTATEIAARNSEIFSSVSSSLGRMKREFVSQVIERTTHVLQKAGKLEEFALDNLEVKYNYISPLSKLQSSVDVENVLEWLGVVGTMGQEVTELTVKMEDVPAWLAKQYGVPQELLREKEETEEIVSVEQEMQTQLQAQGSGAAPQIAGGIAPQQIEGVAGLEGLF